MRLLKTIFPGITALLAIPFLMLSFPKKTRLFLPNKKNEWYVFLEGSAKNTDSKNVFRFEEDVLHVSGDGFGYITTEKKYSDFHFTVEFKWGEKKYPPRENAKRDAGIMYHVIFYNGDKVWPRSLEYQVQEGDCGDFWMTDSTTIVFNDTLTQPKNWLRGMKTKDTEKPNGEWNKAEVIVKDGKITHLLNGVVVNAAKLGNTKEGTILLQSEGAEIYYRNAEVEEL
ncbi:MAG: DUF1080 domain-containing protein [Chitinophagaceae bacterium]